MDPRNLRMTLNAYFSFLKQTKELLLVTFCDSTAGIVKWDGTPTPMDGCSNDRQTDRINISTNKECRYLLTPKSESGVKRFTGFGLKCNW